MESAEQSTALQKRVSLANKHWGLFFSNLPYRVMSLRSLRDSPAITATPAQNRAGISAADAPVTNNLLGDELIKEPKFAI
jgi:hypothetical protein